MAPIRGNFYIVEIRFSYVGPTEEAHKPSISLNLRGSRLGGNKTCCRDFVIHLSHQLNENFDICPSAKNKSTAYAHLKSLNVKQSLYFSTVHLIIF